MNDDQSIRVNFAKPMALFPLDSVVLLPQQVLPLHIFEPRYRQMIERALDSSGQIATAVFARRDWKNDYHGRPPVRPAVCIGQIVQHDSLPDGRFNILLQGVCRARIAKELPADEHRLYRTVMLDPVGSDEESTPELEAARRWVADSLAKGPLSRMTVAEQVLEYVQNDDVPSTAVLELISFALITEPRARYRLLAEADLDRRVQLVRHALDHLSALILSAQSQRAEDWPKGMSWN